MNLEPFLAWYRDTSVAVTIRNSSWLLPAIESAHLVAYAGVVGTAVTIDFRMLNIGLRRQSAARIAAQLAPWTTTALGISVVTGALMLSYDPFKFAANKAFPYKLSLAAMAILFHYAVLLPGVRIEPPTRRTKFAAVCSLLLWLAVAMAGLAVSMDLFGYAQAPD